MSNYILKGRDIVLEPDIIKWAEWYEKADRLVAQTKLYDENGNEIMISTVFLGADHAFGGLPVLFESMIFGGEFDQEQFQYCTWAEAEAGHAKLVEKVKSGK